MILLYAKSLENNTTIKEISVMPNFVYSLKEFKHFSFSLENLPMVEAICLFFAASQRMKLIETHNPIGGIFVYEVIFVSRYLNIFIPKVKIGDKIYVNQEINTKKWGVFKNDEAAQIAAQIIGDWATSKVNIEGNNLEALRFRKDGALMLPGKVYRPTLVEGWTTLKSLSIPYSEIDALRKSVVESRY